MGTAITINKVSNFTSFALKKKRDLETGPVDNFKIFD